MTISKAIYKRSLAISRELCEEGAVEAITTATIVLAMCMRRFYPPKAFTAAVDSIAETIKNMPEQITALGNLDG